MKKFLPKLVQSSEFREKTLRTTNYELRTTNSFGFTLIELLIAVSIIAVLAMIGITVFAGAQKNSRDARRKTDIDSIATALESDFGTNSRTSYQGVVGTMFSGGVIPQDPMNTSEYVYTYPTASATTYVVCAKLEAGSGGNSSANNGTASSGGSYYCRKNQQ